MPRRTSCENLVHPHHARGDGRLDFLDDLLDVVGRHRRLIGEPADFSRDHGKATPVCARLLASIAAFSDSRLV